MIAQHPAGPSVVLFKDKSFQMPIQRSRVKVPVLLHSQMLEVAYFRRFWPFKSKHIIAKSLSLLGTERPNPCILDSLWIMEFGFLPQMAMNGLSMFIEGGSKIANSKSTTFVFLCLSRILGWILLASHCAFLPPIKVRWAFSVKATWELQEDRYHISILHICYYV